jgi:hypothetical protein
MASIRNHQVMLDLISRRNPVSTTLNPRSRHAPVFALGEVVSHFLAPFRSSRAHNAGLAGLPDRILIDIGIDPRDVPSASGNAGFSRSSAKS